MSPGHRSPRCARAILAPTIAALAIGIALPGAAAATANVDISVEGRLGISVPSASGSDGNHGIIVEPFRDAFRNIAFRMR